MTRMGITLLLFPLIYLNMAFADEAEKFSVEVDKDAKLTHLNKTTADGKLVHALDYTMSYFSMLCDNSGHYGVESTSADSDTKYQINFKNDYKGDKREACNQKVSSDIINPYWTATLGVLYYYDDFRSLRGCNLTGYPSATVTFDKLDPSSSYYNKTGFALSAVYEKAVAFEATRMDDQILAWGAVDDSDPQAISLGKDTNLYSCDPRLGSSVSIENYVHYKLDQQHTYMGSSNSGITLYDSGEKNYPVYRFSVVNKTGKPITVVNSDGNKTGIIYCQNQTAWTTAGHVFKEAFGWIQAADAADDLADAEYTIEKIKAANDIYTNIPLNKLKKCTDNSAPIEVPLQTESITVNSGETKNLSNLMMLNNFDFFMDIQLSFTQDGKTETYALSPNSAYKSITFNKGFHEVVFTIGNDDEISVSSYPDIPLEIKNVITKVYTTSGMDEGYPKDTAKEWSMTDAQAKAIVAVGDTTKHLGKTYFFLADGTYLRFDNKLGTVDQDYPMTVSANWKGINDDQAKSIVAVGSDSQHLGKSYFFLADGTYLRYDDESEKVDDGYPKSTAKEWNMSEDQAKSIIAVGNDPMHYGKTYFFLKNDLYLRFDDAKSEIDSGYPKSISGEWSMTNSDAQLISGVGTDTEHPQKLYLFLSNGQYFRHHSAKE